MKMKMKMKMKAGVSFLWTLAAILCYGPSLMCVDSSMLLSSPLVASIDIKYSRRINSFNNSSSTGEDAYSNDRPFDSKEYNSRTDFSGGSMHDAASSPSIGHKKDKNDGIEVITHHDDTALNSNTHGESSDSRRSQKSMDINNNDVNLPSRRDDTDRRGPSNSSSSSDDDTSKHTTKGSSNNHDVKRDSSAEGSSSSLRFQRFNFIHHTMKNFLSHFIVSKTPPNNF